MKAEFHRGYPVAPGIAHGRARVVEGHDGLVVHSFVAPQRRRIELERFGAALDATVADLEASKSELDRGDHSEIVDAYISMLRDPGFIADVEARINSGLNAIWAVHDAAQDVSDALAAVDDPYIAERGSDFLSLAHSVRDHLEGKTVARTLVDADVVVIADAWPVSEVHRLRDVAGVALRSGTPTSHVAIMLRAMGVPSIIGVEIEVPAVPPGAPVVLDATTGRLWIDPPPGVVDEALADEALARSKTDHGPQALAGPVETLDGTRFELHVNATTAADAALAVEIGAAGIGLVRTEAWYLTRETLPTEDELVEHASAIVCALEGRTATFRTFDLGGDKPHAELTPDLEDRNPSLGLRSFRLALSHEAALLTHLRALLRASRFGPIRIMFPMVTSPEEMAAGVRAIEIARGELRDRGITVPRPPIGATIETPGAAMCADSLLAAGDFLSVGTNDLIQYSLAVGRDHESLASYYDPLHPGVLRLLRAVARAGLQRHKPVSICGEMASNPAFVWVLAALGFREFSLSPHSVPRIAALLRRSKLTQMHRVLEEIRDLPGSEARKIVTARLRELLDEDELGSDLGVGALPARADVDAFR